MATVAADFDHQQLAASSSAATHSGVPVYLLRGVTSWKYGTAATPSDFDYVAGQLAGWYTHYYQQTGNALTAWQRATAAEMPGASGADVAAASSYISTAQTGMLLAPVLSDVLGSLTEGIAGTVGDIASSTDAAGTSLAGGADSTNVGSGAARGGEPSTQADGSSGSGKGSGSTAGKAATAVKLTGLAGLLGASGWSGLLVRALEALAGAALILLGLEALTGQGGSPLRAVSKATRSVL